MSDAHTAIIHIAGFVESAEAASAAIAATLTIAGIPISIINHAALQLQMPSVGDYVTMDAKFHRDANSTGHWSGTLLRHYHTADSKTQHATQHEVMPDTMVEAWDVPKPSILSAPPATTSATTPAIQTASAAAGDQAHIEHRQADVTPVAVAPAATETAASQNNHRAQTSGIVSGTGSQPAATPPVAPVRKNTLPVFAKPASRPIVTPATKTAAPTPAAASAAAEASAAKTNTTTTTAPAATRPSPATSSLDNLFGGSKKAAAPRPTVTPATQKKTAPRPPFNPPQQGDASLKF